ncbi:MAG: hypothetical protein DDT41_01376 [candidate division WS2 bacterium]|nr:hypothetical protein [Candidatus Psychracetigena formicireducens]
MLSITTFADVAIDPVLSDTRKDKLLIPVTPLTLRKILVLVEGVLGSAALQITESPIKTSKRPTETANTSNVV